jgi:myo-inositol-1(or 4)-monophosphatase
MNLELITKQVVNLTRAVGTTLRHDMRNLKPSDIHTKGPNDFVTFIDKNSEKRLVSELFRILPEAGFIAEESIEYPRKETYNWLIDPLDGTTNFIHGVPLFAISVALMFRDEIISGVVYEANLQECFYAWKGSKAFLNGQPIRVSPAAKLQDSLLATGFPYSDYSRMGEYLELFTFMMHNTHGVRRLGSAAVDLAYVACGRFDGFYEYGLNPWDVAAGSLIVQQAGGLVTDFRGSGDPIFGKEIIASSTSIYEEFSSVVRRYFYK